jgi:hypothetical protein
MSQPKAFAIDKVSWHTQVEGNTESPERVRRRFKIIADFLQCHGLTVRELLPPGEEPQDDFAIHTSDLTGEGFQVIKKGYDKWLKKVDRGKDPQDLGVLFKALHEVREARER